MSRNSARALALATLTGAVSMAGAQAADDRPGAAVFARTCAVCHGADASGIPGTFPSLHEQIVAFAKSVEGRDYLVMVVSSGLMGEIKLGGNRYNNVMPAQSALSEAELAEVLSYLGQIDITAGEVKDARARHAGNTAPTTRTLRPVEP